MISLWGNLVAAHWAGVRQVKSLRVWSLSSHLPQTLFRDPLMKLIEAPFWNTRNLLRLRLFNGGFFLRECGSR
jgi:hypothetical protein